MRRTSRWRKAALALAAFTLLGTAKAQVDVTSTGGTSPVSYATLGAAFTAINGGTHTGDIVIGISANTTEVGACVLNGSGAGTTSYTSVLLQPTADGVSISGPSATGRGLIELNGADNVTINGDNPNTSGTNRDLTITNTAANTVTFTSVIRLAVATSVVTSADGNSIRNCNLNGSATGLNVSTSTGITAAHSTTYGVYAGGGASTVSASTAPSAISSSTATVGSGATMANLTVSNNSINACGRGIAVLGSALTVVNSLTISNNVIGAATAGNTTTVYYNGISVQGFTAALISNNTVRNIESFANSTTATENLMGIALGNISATGTGAVVEGNRVGPMFNRNTGTYGAHGIYVRLSTASNSTLRKNFIFDIKQDISGGGGFSPQYNVTGIRLAGGTAYNVLHNSVNLFGTQPGTSTTALHSACFIINSTAVINSNVQNNLFSNTLLGGTSSAHVAITLPAAATSAMNLTLNNNAYFCGTGVSQFMAHVGGSSLATTYTAANFAPAATTPATNFRAYSSTLNAGGTNDNASLGTNNPAPFTSNTDLHIPASTITALESGGAAVGVATDIDGEAFGSLGAALAPDIGADEFAGTLPSCFPPSGVTASNVTFVSADINWTNNAADNYDYEVRSSGAAGSGATGLAASGSGMTAGPVTASGLTANTNYSVYLRSHCNGGTETSDWSGAIAFRTGYCTASAGTVDERITNVAVADLNNPSTATTTYEDFTAVVGNVVASLNYPFAITVAPNYTTDQVLIWIDWNQNLDFEAGEQVYVSGLAGPYTGSFTVPPTALPGPTRMRVRLHDTYALNIDYLNTPNATPCGTSTYGQVEDYTLNVTISTCLPPVVTISDITTGEAIASWTDNGASSYEYELRTSGNPGSGATGLIQTSTTTGSPLFISGLSAQTTYTLYLRSLCSDGAEIGPWGPGYAFRTDCIAASIPYSETFNAATPIALPNCFSSQTIAGSTWGTYYITGGTQPFGTAPVGVLPGNAAVQNSWMFLPPMALTGDVSYRLTYKYGVGANPEKMLVAYGTDATAAAMTEVLFDHGTISGVSIATKMIDFTPSVTGVYVIGFKGYSDPPGTFLAVDDITVDLSPPCVAPTVTVSGITTSDATLNWTAGIVDTYEYEVRTSGDAGSGATGLVASGSQLNGPAALTGLASGTTFQVHMRAICLGVPGDWLLANTFSTNCAALNIPYAQNFETATPPALPNCYSTQAISGSSWMTYSGLSGLTGIAAIYPYNAASAANSWLFTPGFTLTGNTSYRLTYRYGNDGGTTYPEKLLVSYGASASAAGMTTQLIDHGVVSGNSGTVQTLDFTPATTGTYYVGFKAYSDANMDFLHVDNITLDLSPPCIEPSAVTALASSTTSVTISWTGNGSGSYDYEVRTSGAAGSGATGLVANGNVAASPAVVPGLIASTTYTVYVRGVCNGGADLSGWVSGGTVTTPCDAVNVPYIQNFDAAVTPALPTCISTQVIDGNAWATANASGDFGLPYTGKVAYYGYNSTLDADSWLYTQSVNLTGGVSYRLSYRYGNDGGSTYIEQMAVWYGSSANAGAMTNLLIDHGPIASTTNVLQVMDFTPASSGTYVIGFHAYSDADQDVLIVDDIRLTVTPTCFPPNDLAVSGITLSNASLTWTDNASGSYDYEVRSSGAPGSGPAGLAASGNAASGASPVTVTGLSGSTTYTAYVRGSCSGGSDLSEWSAGVVFSTVCGTLSAPFLQTFDALSTVPACWSTFSAGTETWGIATGTGAGTDPDYGAEDITDHTSGSGNFAWYDGSTPNDANVTLETPDVDISALTTAQVRFWVFSNNIDDGAQNTLTVAAYDGAAWVNIGTYAANTPSWVRVDMVVPNTIPDLTRFRIIANPSATGSAFYNDLLIDDFRVMEAPTCFPPTDVAISNIAQTSASLDWTNNTSPSYGYEVRTSGAPGSGPTGLALSGTVASGTPAFTLSPLAGSTNYTVYVRGLCNGGSDPSEWTDALAFRTAQGCGTSFVDNGGPGGQQIPDDPVPGDYGVLENSVTTMCPDTPGDLIVVTFSAFSTEEDYDPLYVFNGNSTSAPKISSGNPDPSGTNNVYGAGGWWGETAPNNLAPNVVRASNPSGCLTFAFTSDGSVTALGWEAAVTCFTPNNTCATAAPITCGNVYSGFTTSVAHSMPASCSFNGDPSTGGQNWWTYTAAADEEVTLSTCGATDFDVRLSVFTGTTCGDLACYSMVDNSPGCADGSAQLSFAATNGSTYYIAVHGAGAAEGTYQMAVSCAPLCTPAAGNDACASATAITSAFVGTGVASTGDNSCAHNDAPTACSGADPVQGVWYSFNSGGHNHLLLTLADNSDNVAYTATAVNYALYSGTCSGLGASGEVNCATDAGGYPNVLNVTPNTNYRLLVYNSGGVGVEGTFGLTLEHPAGNDAEVVAITYPAPGIFCSTVIAPTVTLRNNGDGPLNTVQFVYDIDGGTPMTYNWSGPALAFQASASVTLPAITTTSGVHTLNIRTTLPNGAADEVPTNDAKSVTLNISGESMVVSIRTDANGGQTTWQIYDSFFFTVAEGGPYTGQNNTTINTSVCLPTTFGNCYSFYVFDSFGDGMCCANGNGYWELKTNGGAVLLRDRFEATLDGFQSPASSPTSPWYTAGHEFCLPEGPSNILADECGIFTNTLQSKVYCKSIPGVAQYQFEFTDPDGGFRRWIGLPRNWVKFSEMQTVPLIPGVTYFARVRVDQGVAGFSDDHFGTGCEMAITPNLGCTGLIDDIGLPTHSCGVSKHFGGSDKIWAQPMTGGTQYKFRFTNAGEGFVREIERPSYVCLLSWVTLPLHVGATYDVQVNVLVNSVWSGYCGPTCQVTIIGPGSRPEMRIADTADGQLNMWPNPVGDGRVNLLLNGLTEEHQRISVELYDLFGKKVMTQDFENEGPVFNTILHLPNTVAKGVYLVNITINGRTQVQRLSVQ